MPTNSNHPFLHNCDLWVLPPPRLSAWFPKIDWYLNWQMSKGLAYAGLHLPNETHRLAEEFDITLPEPINDPPPPLLILNHGRIPAPKCVVLDVNSRLKGWLERVYEVSENLQAKSIHVFLPTKFEVSEAKEIWSDRFKDRKAKFSSDEEASK